MITPPASASSRTATWNSVATSSSAMNSWPLRMVVGTGRRPSRVMSVSGVVGAAPCACGIDASTSTRAVTLSAAVARKRLQSYNSGLGPQGSGNSLEPWAASLEPSLHSLEIVVSTFVIAAEVDIGFFDQLVVARHHVVAFVQRGSAGHAAAGGRGATERRRGCRSRRAATHGRRGGLGAGGALPRRCRLPRGLPGTALPRACGTLARGARALLRRARALAACRGAPLPAGSRASLARRGALSLLLATWWHTPPSRARLAIGGGRSKFAARVRESGKPRIPCLYLRVSAED